MHILSPETDNCPSWISGRERITVENILSSISTKECCRSRRELNPQSLCLQSDGASNWATETGMIRFNRVFDGRSIVLCFSSSLFVRMWFHMYLSRKHTYIFFTSPWGFLTSTHNLCLCRNMKNIRIFIWKLSVFWWWKFRYIWIGVFS